MSLRDCVDRAVKAGEMDQGRAATVLAEYDNIFPQMRKNFGHAQAEAETARLVVKQAQFDAFEKRRIMQLTAAATRSQLERMTAHTNILNKQDPAQYTLDLISNDRGATGATLNGKYKAVRAWMYRDFTVALQTFRSNLLGVRRHKKDLDDVGRELFGENSGNANARTMAQSFTAISEKARMRRNASGGHTGKLDDWGLPHEHDSRAIRKAGYDEWRAEQLKRLDLENIINPRTELPFTPEAFEVILHDAYQAIRTDGYSRRAASSKYGSSMANRRADHRFFKYKSYEDWKAYDKRFGSGNDIFRVMRGHIENMSMDIALMEELGPNPVNTFSHLIDASKRLAAISSEVDAPMAAGIKTKMAANVFDAFTGASNVPNNPRAAKYASGLRNWLSSSQLGFAIASSITDFNTQRASAAFIGLNQSGFLKPLMRALTSKNFRGEANRAGLILDNGMDIGNAVGRFELEEFHFEMPARAADFTIRSTGLGFATESHRQAAGMGFMSDVANDYHGKQFSELPEEMQRMFNGYGIGSENWGLINGAKLHDANGVPILRAEEIEAVAGQKVADMYMEAILGHIEHAVVSSNLYARTLLLAGTKPGSIPGELARFGAQYKSFPTSFAVLHIGRMVQEVAAGRARTALTYAASIFVFNTLLGGVALQLKAADKGQDPRDMTEVKFWVAAMAQGGGLGIFGDFLFADQNRFGGSIGETLSGPGVGFFSDVAKYSIGNAQEAIAGEQTNIGRETVDMFRRYTPGGGNWYIGLAFEREVLDQIQTIVDPNAAASFRSRSRNAEQYGTEYYFPPGSSVIGGQGNVRAPDLENAIGG